MIDKIKSILTNFKPLFYTLFLFFIVLLFSVLLGMSLMMIYGDFSDRLARVIIVNSLFVSLGIILTFLIIKLFLFRINGALTILLSFALTFGVCITGLFLTFLLEPLFFLSERKLIYSYIIINLLFIISLNIIISVFLIYNRKVTEEMILRKEMEQKLYISRINPHFLFNSLNLMISLLSEPQRAETALLDLSGLLRFNLDAAKRERITIKEELENVESYLKIQKLRFEERLSYKFSCNTEVEVPPLIIQPLVENSIKYNINDINPLIIEIKVSRVEERTLIEVADSARRVKESMVGNGIGLANTRRRIELAGGELKIINGEIRIVI